MPYRQYHCTECHAEQTRYHNVRNLVCSQCGHKLAPGKSELSYYQRMDLWIETHSCWDEHPDFPVRDWQYEVANDDTRSGYQDWLLSQADAREDEGDPP